MTTTTLAIVNAPTLMDGVTELLHVATALGMAGESMGVTMRRYVDGQLESADPDPELPAGVLATELVPELDPWQPDIDTTEDRARGELLQLLQLLSAATARDLLGTADGVHLL